ncbi:hypothetical protein M422DRAFT_263917 [Sphaerobolus stellatus SS14]|uniref:Uncharacterized protein n=1 Tax=Sphaerobolus stellatus (strain SS14) TaxID=990650 RepID=A0A0C9UGS1_SPHS4|nr:hypothetical protein M422DRAFT_263917 [Sphaerobolus stellatus SS14]
MAAKRSYKIRLSEKDVSHAVAEAWPELVRYQDDYYHLLEDYNTLKEKTQSAEKKAEDRRAKMNELYEKLNTHRSNPVGLPKHEELILENKHLQQELDYYIGRVQFALYGKDADWVIHNGYCLGDIPASDSEDDDEDHGGLPTLPEEIPQDVPVHPPTKLARPVGKSHQNESKVVHEAGIPAIGGSRLPPSPKRIIETDIHDSEMRKLYIKGRALQPHLRSPDHTAVIFCIDEYAKSLPGLPRHLVVCHDDPSWMINVVQAFNANPSGIPQNLRLKGLYVNVDDADIWYWLNLIKPKFRGAEAGILLQSIFSTVGKWNQMITGQWKRNDSLFLCSSTTTEYQINRNQKFDRHTFTYWLGCDTGTIWNEVTLCSQLRANKITLLKGNPMNQFWVHDDLLPLIRESPYYFPPSMGEPMDQDEVDPETNPIQHTTGPLLLANRLDYGERGSFLHPPANAHELWAQVSYFNSLVPQGTAHESNVEFTEALTRNMYVDNHE